MGPNDYFQVEIRNRYNAHSPVIDESVPPIDVAWVKVKYYQHYVDKAYDTEYTWRVSVVRGTPAREKQWSTQEYRVWEPGVQLTQVSQSSATRTVYLVAGAKPLPAPPANASGPPDERESGR